MPGDRPNAHEGYESEATEPERDRSPVALPLAQTAGAAGPALEPEESRLPESSWPEASRYPGLAGDVYGR